MLVDFRVPCIFFRPFDKINRPLVYFVVVRFIFSLWYILPRKIWQPCFTPADSNHPLLKHLLFFPKEEGWGGDGSAINRNFLVHSHLDLVHCRVRTQDYPLLCIKTQCVTFRIISWKNQLVIHSLQPPLDDLLNTKCIKCKKSCPKMWDSSLIFRKLPKMEYPS
jgi:hypothetical protein